MLSHNTNKTFVGKKKNNSYDWYIFDASFNSLGRLASEIAKILLGKNEEQYTTNQIIQHGVIVINAEKIVISGRKEKDKFYYKHSGTPGGLTIKTFKELRHSCPTKIIEQSVKRMLPKGVLGRELFTKLKVYKGPNHPHRAQSPRLISLL